MLRILILSCLVAVVCSQTASDCGPNNQVKIYDVSIRPHPIWLPGTFHVDGSGELFTRLDDISVDLTLLKRVGMMNVRVPCRDGIGSCKYEDVCGMLDEYFADGCPEELVRRGLPCKCPFDPIRVNFKDFEAVIDEEDIPEYFKGIITGKYIAEAKIMNRGKQISCNKVEFELEAK